MANLLAQAAQGAGIAVGFQQGMSPEREANRAAARAQREEGDQKLARLKATKPTQESLATEAETQALEIKNLNAQAKQTLNTTMEQMSYRSLERYDGSGEVRHLNQFMQDNPDNLMWGDVNSVERLSEADRKMMTDAGDEVDPDDAINDPDISRSFLKAHMKDGTTQIINLDDIKGSTRYNKYASTVELERMTLSKKKLMLRSFGYDATPEGLEAFRVVKAQLPPGTDPESPEFQNALTEEMNRVREAKKHKARGAVMNKAFHDRFSIEAERRATEVDELTPGTPEWNKARMEHYDTIRRTVQAAGIDLNDPRLFRGTADERHASNLINEENPGMFESDPQQWLELYNDEHQGIRDKKQRTSKMKDVEATVAIRETMKARVEPESNKSVVQEIQDPATRSKYEDDMIDYKQQKGYKRDSAKEKVYRQMRQIVRLAGKSSNMTEDSTGPFDSIFHSAKQYFTNIGNGTQEKAAFALMNNYAINAMFGATVPVNEEKRAVAAFGSDKLQLAHIFDKIAVNLETIRDEMEDVMEFDDPYIAAWDLGMSRDQADEILENLNSSIARLRGKQSVADAEGAGPVVSKEDIKIEGVNGVTEPRMIANPKDPNGPQISVKQMLDQLMLDRNKGVTE